MAVKIVNGVVVDGVRDNHKGFLATFNESGVSLLRVGNESRLHMKVDDGSHVVRIMCDLDELAAAFSGMKEKNGVRSCELKDLPMEGEKTKPSSLTVVVTDNGCTVTGTGPDERNRTQKTSSMSPAGMMDFLKGIVADHMNMVEFECVGDKNSDAKKIKRRLERLNLFTGRKDEDKKQDFLN